MLEYRYLIHWRIHHVWKLKKIISLFIVTNRNVEISQLCC
jgi:hypothetical protein